MTLIILVYLSYPYDVSVECSATLVETATRSLEQKYPLSVYSHSLCELGDCNL